MKFGKYIKDKLGIIAGYAGFVIFTYLLMMAFHSQLQMRIMFVIVAVIFVVSVIAFDYLRKYKFYNSLVGHLDELDQKYLILDTLDEPDFYEGKLVYSAMYDINKSMTENVRKYRDSVEDFKDFIEIWVHEIKLPIASLVLMCHNNRDVIPRKYEEQVARLDAYADQVLYYVRAEHASADYRFAETNLKSVIGRVAVKNKDMLLDGDISLNVHDVEAGEFVAIMGASGSGKTTLLNCVSTIDKVSSGHIYVGGKDITTLKGNKLNEFRREELGFIFQDFNLLDTLTAYENVALALSIQNVPAKQIDAKVRAVAKELEIESVLKKYPYQMSGGQKQRVASARAIITDPKLVLADEPTGALDSKSAKLLLERFKHLNEDLMTTILMVTHDSFTASYAGRILFIKDGKVFHELRRGGDTRKEFFNKIIDVVTLLGGDLNDAL